MKFLWILWPIFAILLGVMTIQLLQEKNQSKATSEETRIESISESINETEKEASYEVDITIGDQQLWVEVDLGKQIQKVIIHEGKAVLKEMLCSGGTEENPTVMGKFYLKNRGEWFYSERFDEGALYWVRFHEEYLFHSVPVDKAFKVIEAEKAKIGSPASHGCIRLLEEDAKWFYDNVPDDTLVLIHD